MKPSNIDHRSMPDSTVDHTRQLSPDPWPKQHDEKVDKVDDHVESLVIAVAGFSPGNMVFLLKLNQFLYKL